MVATVWRRRSQVDDNDFSDLFGHVSGSGFKGDAQSGYGYISG